MTTYGLSVPAVLSLVAGVLTLVQARWVWQFRDRPGAIYWTGVQIAVAVWALGYGVGLTVFDPRLRGLVEPAIWFGRQASPPLALLFALEYTGRDHLARSRWRAALFGFYGLGFALYLTNPIHHLAWTDFGVTPVFGAAAVDYTPGIVLYFYAFSAYATLGVAAALILGPLISYRRLFGRQAVALLVVLLLPTATSIAWLFRLGPTAHLDLTAPVFLVTFAGVSYALFEGELFELLPATTRVANDIAIDDIDAAVITLSPGGRLIDLNEAAVDLFGLGRSSVGRPVDDLLDVELPLEEASFSVSDPGRENREFNVTVSSIDSSGDLIGYVVTFYDVTAERRRQQRLAVQNRILRHNLRNGLDVVRGNAEEIRQVAGTGVDPFVEEIRDTSEQLLGVSEKVRAFDAALSEDPTVVDVGRLCERVVEAVAGRYPEAEITVEGDPDVHVECRPSLLRQVVAETVENGVVHSGTDRPAVTVTLSETADGVTISVEDDGPGIPEYEIAALQEGEEGALSHGSSVGLWIVEWGIDVLGGTVSFRTDGGGTTVSIRLPGR